jgi:hypothetical protein
MKGMKDKKDRQDRQDRFPCGNIKSLALFHAAWQGQPDQ